MKKRNEQIENTYGFFAVAVAAKQFEENILRVFNPTL